MQRRMRPTLNLPNARPLSRPPRPALQCIFNFGGKYKYKVLLVGNKIYYTLTLLVEFFSIKCGYIQAWDRKQAKRTRYGDVDEMSPTRLL